VEVKHISAKYVIRAYNDTRMDNHTIFEPGWKRAPQLDTEVEKFDDSLLSLTEESKLVCSCHAGDNYYMWQT
jgi:hypothetical protein